jgi:hypothetical protein
MPLILPRHKVTGVPRFVASLARRMSFSLLSFIVFTSQLTGQRQCRSACSPFPPYHIPRRSEQPETGNGSVPRDRPTMRWEYQREDT